MNFEHELKILESWNSCRSSSYTIQKEHFLWNLKYQSLIDYSVIEFESRPLLIAVASNEGVAFGLSPETLWLSLWGPVPNAKCKSFVEFLGAQSRRLRKNRIQIGGEEFHFLPGAPDEDPSDQLLIQGFLDQKFHKSHVVDLTGLASHPLIDRYIIDSTAQAKLQGLQLNQEHTELDQFLSKEFPGRWHREFLYWLKNPTQSKSKWLTLLDSQQTAVGFARISKRSFADQNSDWTPGALKLPLRPGSPPVPSDGTLGPIGIANSHRGKGSGKVLLGLTLQALRQNQVERICIDWTNAFKYYEPLGFERIRSYQSIWRTQSQ